MYIEIGAKFSQLLSAKMASQTAVVSKNSGLKVPLIALGTWKVRSAVR